MIPIHAIGKDKSSWDWRDLPWKVREKGKELFGSFWNAAFGIPEEKPSSLPMDGFPGDDKYTWNDWSRDMQAKYPFRYFMTEEVPIFAARLYRIFWSEPYYWLRTHTIHRYHMVDARAPQNGYHWGWFDRSGLVLFAAFAVLVDFVEKEYPGCVDWDYDEEHRKGRDEFMALYNWWKYGRRREHDAFDAACEVRYTKRRGKVEEPAEESNSLLQAILRETGISKVFGEIFERRKSALFGEKGSWNYPERQEDFEKFHKWEMDLEAKDNEMLKRLIDIRGILWT
jgi:hypothetical protein